MARYIFTENQLIAYGVRLMQLASAYAGVAILPRSMMSDQQYGIVIPVDEPIVIMTEQHVQNLLDDYSECMTDESYDPTQGFDCRISLVSDVMHDAALETSEMKGDGPWLV